MATLSRLQPGQIVYSVESVGCGNTNIRRKTLYKVKIVEIDAEKRTVLASWNGNPPRVWTERMIAKWKVKEPKPKIILFGMPSY